FQGAMASHHVPTGPVSTLSLTGPVSTLSLTHPAQQQQAQQAPLAVQPAAAAPVAVQPVAAVAEAPKAEATPDTLVAQSEMIVSKAPTTSATSAAPKKDAGIQRAAKVVTKKIAFKEPPKKKEYPTVTPYIFRALADQFSKTPELVQRVEKKDPAKWDRARSLLHKKEPFCLCKASVTKRVYSDWVGQYGKLKRKKDLQEMMAARNTFVEMISSGIVDGTFSLERVHEDDDYYKMAEAVYGEDERWSAVDNDYREDYLYTGIHKGRAAYDQRRSSDMDLLELVIRQAFQSERLSLQSSDTADFETVFRSKSELENTVLTKNDRKRVYERLVLEAREKQEREERHQMRLNRVVVKKAEDNFLDFLYES
ncbi:hypothetical protein KIPB_009909, partial [Kipferlia bialata]